MSEFGFWFHLATDRKKVKDRLPQKGNAGSVSTSIVGEET